MIRSDNNLSHVTWLLETERILGYAHQSTLANNNWAELQFLIISKHKQKEEIHVTFVLFSEADRSFNHNDTTPPSLGLRRRGATDWPMKAISVVCLHYGTLWNTMSAFFGEIYKVVNGCSTRVISPHALRPSAPAGAEISQTTCKEFVEEDWWTSLNSTNVLHLISRGRLVLLRKQQKKKKERKLRSSGGK